MKFSNIIDLRHLFEQLKELRYVIVRLPKYYPNYREYSDLDIFCEDKSRMASLIQNVISFYGDIRVSHLPGRIHVDYYSSPRQLDIKFDLFDSFEIYSKTYIDPLLKQVLLETRVLNDRNVYVPLPVYEDALRFVEYREYISSRPDKIKHLVYLRNRGDDFIEVLNQYTNLENVKELIHAS